MRALLITATRLGDAVLSTGAVPFLAARYPGVRLTVACGPLPAPMFEAMPEVAEVWPMRKRPMAGHWHELWCRAVRHRWTHVVDLRGSAFAYTVRADRRTVMQPGRALRHRVLHLTETLGASAPLAPRLCWSGADAAEAHRRMGADGPWLAVGPTANWPGKVWPAERFGAVARALVGPDGPLAGAAVLIAGAPGEENSAGPLFEALKDCRTVPAFGWPLPVMAAALGGARMYIGNDSGLMHMAAAVGTPTVGLFGPSRPELYAPWGDRTAVVRTATPYETFASLPGFGIAATGSLMGEIATDAVTATATALLRRTAGGEP